MNKILMSLSIALASWTLMPANASAAPQDCDVVCHCGQSCVTKCTNGGAIWTCGGAELPCGGCAAEPAEEASAMVRGEYSEEDQVCRALES